MTPKQPPLLIAILALGALLAAALLAAFLALYHPSHKKAATHKPSSETPLTLSTATPLPGTPLLRMLLDPRQFSFKGSASKNILIVDSSTSQSWWLLPNSNGIVLTTTDLFKPFESLETFPNPSSTSKQFIASLYEVISSDSNGYEKITFDDNREIFLSTNRPGDWKRITSGARKILAATQISTTQAVVIYQTSTETRTKTFSLPDGETLSENSIPTIP
jgi:hypothetical protein